MVKKFLSLMLALAMVLALGSIAYAGTAESKETGSITVKNPIAKQGYYVYRIFDLESYDAEQNAYSYKLNETWKDFAELNTVRGKYITLEEKNGTTYVNWIEGADVTEFAKLAINWIKETETDLTVDGITPLSATDIVFKNLPLGYYLIDSSVGALCAITTNDPDAQINEKNGLSTIEKLVKEDSDGKFSGENSAQVGDTVEFKSEVTVGEGAENLVVHDKMDQDLNLDATSFTLKIEDTDIPAENYTVKTEGLTDGCTFEITFTNDYVSTLKTGSVIQIGYKAVIGKDAATKTDASENKTWISFGDGLTSTESSTKTYTASVHIFKTNDKDTVLAGAEFYLYDAKTGGNRIPLVLVKSNDTNGINVYRVATLEDGNVGDGAAVKAGFAVIEGLDRDVYYLEEAKNPDGYNKLSERVMIDLRSGSITSGLTLSDYLTGESKAVGMDVANTAGVKVVNKAGTELPSTGGIGTTVFYVLGGTLAAAGFVLLVVKKRMAFENK